MQICSRMWKETQGAVKLWAGGLSGKRKISRLLSRAGSRPQQQVDHLPPNAHGASGPAVPGNPAYWGPKWEWQGAFPAAALSSSSLSSSHFVPLSVTSFAGLDTAKDSESIRVVNKGTVKAPSVKKLRYGTLSIFYSYYAEANCWVHKYFIDLKLLNNYWSWDLISFSLTWQNNKKGIK